MALTTSAPGRSRGSSHHASTSPSVVHTARNTAAAAPQPAASGTSRVASASNIRRPSPGHAVTSSTASDPLSSVPAARPSTDATGDAVGRHSARHSQRPRPTPRALAASTCRAAVPSATAACWMRSSEAASGRPSASTGTIRWCAMSRTREPASHSSAPALCMPPAGAQPVRTAITVSTSATSSGGSENSTSEIAPTTPARRGKRPLPEIRPNGTADRDRDEERRAGEQRRVRGARGHQRQDRLAVAERRAEVEPYRVADPAGDAAPAADDRARGGCAHARSARPRRLRAAFRW